MRVLGQKTTGGGAKRPPPSLYRVKGFKALQGPIGDKLSFLINRG